MSKKGILLIVFVSMVIISLQFLNHENQEKIVDSISKSPDPNLTEVPENQDVASTKGFMPSPPLLEAAPINKIIVNERRLQEDQDKLSALINQYDQNLSDPLKRHEIEQLVSKTSESYKREVLAKVKSLRE